MSEDKEIKEIQKVILPMIRKVLPNLIANELINTQPMTGSAGQMFTMGRISRWRRFQRWCSNKYWDWVPGTVITLKYPDNLSALLTWLEANVGRRGRAWNLQHKFTGLEVKFIWGKGKWATITAMKWA
jgi:hypothetical protein